MRCANEVLEERVDPSGMKNAKALGRNILERTTSGEAEMTAFDEFSAEITTCLRSIM